MLRVFRWARRQLLSEGKVRGYLLYGIGEIALVVFGILIALQINNWNDRQKKQKIEIQTYREIKDDLEKTMGDINSDLSRHEDHLRPSLALRAWLLTGEGDPDSMSVYLRQAARDFQLFPKVGAFEALKSRGLETLTNDTLRLKVTDLYQLGITSLESLGRELSQSRNIDRIMSPYLAQHLTLATDVQETALIPDTEETIDYYQEAIIDLDQLQADKSLLSTLESVIRIRMFKMQRHVELRLEIQALIRDIQKEIDRLVR